MKTSENILTAVFLYFIKISTLHFIIVFIFLSYFGFAQGLPENEMRAHYINIGQGNATLLEFSCGAILIDAGAEGPTTQKMLTRYLGRFFTRRSDLNKTLNLVIVTHAHKDHNFGLRDVFTKFKVLNYVDNGLRYGSGKSNQKWAIDNVNSIGVSYRNYSYDQAIAVAGKKGITDLIIDPVNCLGIDPEISILSGRFDSVPTGITKAELDGNGNLHSLVVRVKFGKSSFLFSGDLEEKAMNQVAEFYKDTQMLDCDVWEVSHHGSYNGITREWLKEVTPKFAVISCGKWDNGKVGAKDKFNTYNFGHPRIIALDLLENSIDGKRPELDSVEAFYGIKEKHRKYKVTKNIYCTAWDGTIVMRASENGSYNIVE